MNNLPLGKQIPQPESYAPEVLRAIPRDEARGRLGISSPLPTFAPDCPPHEPVKEVFYGIDHWHAWELSWLTKSGRPAVAVGEFFFDAASPNLVESKSLKLYLNSLNNEVYQDTEHLQGVITRDLSAASGAETKVLIYEVGESGKTPLPPSVLPLLPAEGGKSVNASYAEMDDGVPDEGKVGPGICLDALEVSRWCSEPMQDSLIAFRQWEPKPNAMCGDLPPSTVNDAELYTHLFRCNCPVTGQPDWASVKIRYSGVQLDESSVLAYLLSYRGHRAFHEECAERIFRDLRAASDPSSPRLGVPPPYFSSRPALWVGMNFLRRGGLDINVYRSTAPLAPATVRRRLPRQ